MYPLFEINEKPTDILSISSFIRFAVCRVRSTSPTSLHFRTAAVKVKRLGT
jgi:hypothetical protein